MASRSTSDAEPARPAPDRAGAVRAGEELPQDRLLSFLQRAVPGLEGPLTVRQFHSGYSNLTYLVETPDRALVLRRPPAGSDVATAHDMAREYKVLCHLYGGAVPVPRPICYCDDAEVLGAPFFVMERVPGVILRGTLRPEEAPPPARLQGIAAVLVKTLAQVHAVDYEAIGLGDLGRPEGYVARQVKGWTRRFARARTGDTPGLDRVAAWLGQHLPTSPEPTLLHNDFKHDNLVLAPDDLTDLRAVLDWEMATVGDPLMDLGTTLAYWVEPDDPAPVRALRLSPTALPGTPGRLAVAEAYGRFTGRPLDDLVFYYVFGVFRLAVIIQQIYRRYREGHTRDPRFAKLHAGVEACALLAGQAIEHGRLDRLFEME